MVRMWQITTMDKSEWVQSGRMSETFTVTGRNLDVAVRKVRLPKSEEIVKIELLLEEQPHDRT